MAKFIITNALPNAADMAIYQSETIDAWEMKVFDRAYDFNGNPILNNGLPIDTMIDLTSAQVRAEIQRQTGNKITTIGNAQYSTQLLYTTHPNTEVDVGYAVVSITIHPDNRLGWLRFESVDWEPTSRLQVGTYQGDVLITLGDKDWVAMELEMSIKKSITTVLSQEGV